MAGEPGVPVQGKVYAAFLLAQDDFAAKPLMAGMVKLDPSDGMSYKRLEVAAELNGVHFWTTKIVLEDQQLPLEVVQASYKLWIDERRSRFEKKTKKAMSDDVPRLSPILSGITFIERAVSIGILTPETAQRCRLLKSPSVSSGVLPGCLPTLPDGQAGVSSSSPAVPQVQEEVLPGIPLMPGDENADNHDYQAVTDTFELAVEEIGLDGNEVTIIGEESGIEDNQQGVVESARDLDRDVEDALLQAETLSEDNPVYTNLVATVKRLQSSHKDQCKMIRTLNHLSLAQESRLLAYQANSAEQIAAGLAPTLKNTLQELKREAKKEMLQEIGELKEEGKQELAGIKSSIATLTIKVDEVMKLGQSTMGAAALVNENLKAAGIVVKEDPLAQVDIPGALLKITSKLNSPEAASSLSSSLPLSSRVGLGAKINSITSPSSFANGNTPRQQQTSSSATPASSNTPRKPSRFRDFLSTNESPSANKTLGLNKQAKGQPTARNISEQFDLPNARNAASTPGLRRDMMTGKGTWASPQPQHQMTQAQIYQKLKEMGAASVAQKRPRKD